VKNIFADISAGYGAFQTKISRVYSTIKTEAKSFQK